MKNFKINSNTAVIHLSAIVMVGNKVALPGALFGKIAQKLHRPRVIEEVDDSDFEPKPRDMGIFYEIINIT